MFGSQIRSGSRGHGVLFVFSCPSPRNSVISADSDRGLLESRPRLEARPEVGEAGGRGAGERAAERASAAAVS
jgi:hypothetical protein